MKGPPKKYRGRLSVDNIASGIEVCLDNARYLVGDGISLLKAGRPPRALSCFIAAQQEIGKVHVLLAMTRIHPENQAQWSDRWKSFYSHEMKITHAFMDTVPDFARTSPETVLGEVKQIAAAEATAMQERLRQKTLYVDYSHAEGRWLSPLEIDPAIVEEQLEIAVNVLNRLETFRDMGFFSVEALRIQHEELSPVTKDLHTNEDLNVDDINGLVLPAMKRFWKRLVYEGIVTPLDDATIAGQPWREFIDG